MIRKSVLDKFVRLGGYEIVKKKRGKWKNISEASRRTGLSRMTIYGLLEEYPAAPRKILPKYVAEFHKSEAYRRLKEQYEKRLSSAEYQNTVYQVMEGWKFLDKKDPISWGEEDFRKIWKNEKWHHKKARGFEEHNATKFHRLMRAIGRHDLLLKLKGKKIPAGAKKEWFLHDEDIIKTTGNFEDKGALVYYECGILWGARSSALLNTRVKDINFEDHSVTVYESKTQDYLQKFPPLCIFGILRRYIEDKRLSPQDKIFPHNYDYYNKALRDAGKKAKLTKTITTHIMKHTFVSQGHRHGLSRETVVEMTGTEDRTIKAYYLSLDEKKIRQETQGLAKNEIPFYEWAESLHPYFQQKYQQLDGTPQLEKNIRWEPEVLFPVRGPQLDCN